MKKSDTYLIHRNGQINIPLKKIVLLLVVFMSMQLHAQSGLLQIKELNGNMVQEIKTGTWISAVTTSDEMVKGRFKILDDSTLVLSKDTIPLSALRQLTVPNKSSASTGIGLTVGSIALVVAGSGVTFIGLVIALFTAENGLLYTGIGMVAASIPTAIGAIVCFSKKTNYSINEHFWSIKRKQ